MDWSDTNSAVKEPQHIDNRRLSAEEALRVSEARYRRLFETAQDGILLLDGETGAITDANPFLLSLLGYPLEELLGKKLWEIGPFKDIEDSKKAFSVLQHDDYIRYEDLPLQSKSGHKVDVEFVSNAYPVDGLRVIQCNVRDITMRKRAEAALLSTSLQLQRALVRSPTMFYSLKVAGTRIGALEFMSENILQLLGYEVSESYKYHWWLDRIHPEDSARVIAGKDRLLETGSSNNDYRFRHSNGSYRWLRDEQRLVRDAQGEPLEILGTLTEITERKDLEDQLRQAMKMEAIGRLAGGVAHDFNNLLSVIIGYSQMLLQKDSCADDVREPSEQILSAAKRASALTRQLLSFSRKQVLRLRTTDLNLVVAGISKMLQRIIGEDISLAFESLPEMLLVDADEGLLEQVLMNLAINARDAMPKGGKLSIDTGRTTIDRAGFKGQLHECSGDYVWIRVRDSGCGMTPVTQARIFEPFFTTKDVGKGTGLGLATVYGIVRQHRGWIEVVSQVESGTVFTIFLPAAASLRPMVVTPGPTAGNLLSGTETILLVEDEPALQLMTTKVLEGLGYRVLTADNGRAALSVWAQHRSEIDLLFTDMVMPGGLTGSDLAAKLQGEDPGLRVVLTSGYNSAQTGSIVLQEGVNFLPKPYNLEMLSQIIRSNLDGRESGAIQFPQETRRQAQI
jgi:two-component system, cell cycle sensor histidine kinase and response regulator CckA